jgi:hypothetical protein
MKTNIPNNWNTAEVNEYFNIRLNSIERLMVQLVSGFENTVPDEESVNGSTSLRAATKIEMINTMNEIKNKIKKK